MDLKDAHNPSGPVTLAGGKTISVNRDTCIGCGSCTGIAPDAFDIDEESKSCVLASADDASDDTLESAKNGCPTRAISVE